MTHTFGGSTSLALLLTLASLSACGASLGSKDSASAASRASAAPAAEAGAQAPSAKSARRLAAEFVEAVVSEGGAKGELGGLVFLGPALYAQVAALDPDAKTLGTAVTLMNPDVPGSVQETRMCAGESCTAFLHTQGLRSVLGPFVHASYRPPTSGELGVMLALSPSVMPADTPAIVGVAGDERIGFFAWEGHIVWLDLLSASEVIVY